MTRAEFPNTDRFQGCTLLLAGALSLMAPWFIINDQVPTQRDLNSMLCGVWLFVSFCILAAGAFKVQRGSRLKISGQTPQSADHGQEQSSATPTLTDEALDTYDPFLTEHTPEACPRIAAILESAAQAQRPKLAEAITPGDASYDEARAGKLPKDVYRVFDYVSFEGRRFDVEISGQNYTLGSAASDVMSAERFHTNSSQEQIETEARAFVAEHCGIAAAKAAQFRHVFVLDE